MSSCVKPLFRILNCLLLAIVLLTMTTGCFPEVVWLPDSSGVAFSDDSKRIIRFDIKDNGQKVILSDASELYRFAISPDGSRIAFAENSQTTQKGSNVVKHSRQIHFIDLDGKKLPPSSVHTTTDQLETPAEKDETKAGAYITHWFGAKQQLIVSNQDSTSAIYDIATQKWSDVDALPYYIFANGGIRPDGKGFLGVNKKDGLVFVTPDGWLSSFDAQLDHDVLFWTHWDKNVAKFITNKGVDEFDTETKKHVFKPTPLPILATNSQIQWVYQFPTGDMYICLVKLESGWSFEAHVPSAAKRKTILKTSNEVPLKQLGNITFPSPDGTKVAIRLRENILIIDNNGILLSTIKLDDNYEP